MNEEMRLRDRIVAYEHAVEGRMDQKDTLDIHADHPQRWTSGARHQLACVGNENHKTPSPLFPVAVVVFLLLRRNNSADSSPRCRCRCRRRGRRRRSSRPRRLLVLVRTRVPAHLADNVERARAVAAGARTPLGRSRRRRIGRDGGGGGGRLLRRRGGNGSGSSSGGRGRSGFCGTRGGGLGRRRGRRDSERRCGGLLRNSRRSDRFLIVHVPAEVVVVLLSDCGRVGQ